MHPPGNSEISKYTKTTPWTLTRDSPMVTMPQRCYLAWNYGSNGSGVPVSAVYSKSHIALLPPPRMVMFPVALIGSRPCSTPKYTGPFTLRRNYASREYFPQKCNITQLSLARPLLGPVLPYHFSPALAHSRPVKHPTHPFSAFSHPRIVASARVFNYHFLSSCC